MRVTVKRRKEVMWFTVERKNNRCELTPSDPYVELADKDFRVSIYKYVYISEILSDK